MYALLDIKGKQYKAVKGELLKVDKINAKKDDKIEFYNVMFIKNNNDIKIGKPYIANAYVKGVYKEDKKDKKVISYRYIRREASERKIGHRQVYSYILIDDIVSRI